MPAPFSTDVRCNMMRTHVEGESWEPPQSELRGRSTTVRSGEVLASGGAGAAACGRSADQWACGAGGARTPAGRAAGASACSLLLGRARLEQEQRGVIGQVALIVREQNGDDTSHARRGGSPAWFG